MKKILLLILLCSTRALAVDPIDSQVIAESAIEIRRLKEQISVLQKQVAAQETASSARARTAETKIAQLCSVCNGTTFTTPPPPPPLLPTRPEGPQNWISLVGGQGPDGVKTEKDPVTGLVSASVNVAPIVGLEYTRLLYEMWSINVIVTRGVGSSSTTYTGLIGAGLGF